MELFRIRNDIPFMRHALVLNAISALTFVLAVFFLVTRGLHLSGEFTGGTVMEVAYEQPADLEAVRKVIDPAAFVWKGRDTPAGRFSLRSGAQDSFTIVAATTKSSTGHVRSPISAAASQGSTPVASSTNLARQLRLPLLASKPPPGSRSIAAR